MEESAKVLEINGSIAIVEVEKTEQCEKCCACKMGSEGKRVVEVENTLNANIGDKVCLQIEAKDILKASFIVYLIPTIAFISGIVITQYLLAKIFNFGNHQQIISLAVGVVLLGISFKIINLYDKRVQNTSLYKPKMVEIANRK